MIIILETFTLYKYYFLVINIQIKKFVNQNFNNQHYITDVPTYISYISNEGYIVSTYKNHFDAE